MGSAWVAPGTRRNPSVGGMGAVMAEAARRSPPKTFVRVHSALPKKLLVGDGILGPRHASWLAHKWSRGVSLAAYRLTHAAHPFPASCESAPLADRQMCQRPSRADRASSQPLSPIGQAVAHRAAELCRCVAGQVGGHPCSRRRRRASISKAGHTFVLVYDS